MHSPLAPGSHNAYSIDYLVRGRTGICCAEPFDRVTSSHQTPSNFKSEGFSPSGTRVTRAAPVQDQDSQTSGLGLHSSRYKAIVLEFGDFELSTLVIPQDSQAVEDCCRIPEDSPGGSQIDCALELVGQ